MKSLALIAAALSLSAGAAFADCSYHKTTAALDVDRSITTASVAVDEDAAEKVVLLKQSRLPAEEQTATE
ncbi:hypothetical protein [Rhizobium arsenicireducens]|jgi:hypothetical protein